MAREFTVALDRLLQQGFYPGLRVALLVQTDVNVAALDLRAIDVERLGPARGHVWEQAILPWHVRGAWLLNLGNTAPLVSLYGTGAVAVVVHDLSHRLFPTAYRLLYRFAHRILGYAIMKRARLVVTVSESERRTITELYPRAISKITVAQNGGASDDEPIVRTGPVIRPAAPYGIYVGSLSRRKNINVVLQVAIELARERNLHFKFVGSPSPILHEMPLTIPSDVADYIEFCGQVDDKEELATLYRGASFLLFPSLYEASALPPIEAMSYGCPVIASDIPALRERCGDAAFYCGTHEIAQIKLAAGRLLDEPGMREKAVSRGAAWAARFSWRAQVTLVIAEIMRLSSP